MSCKDDILGGAAYFDAVLVVFKPSMRAFCVLSTMPGVWFLVEHIYSAASAKLRSVLRKRILSVVTVQYVQYSRSDKVRVYVTAEGKLEALLLKHRIKSIAL